MQLRDGKQFSWRGKPFQPKVLAFHTVGVAQPSQRLLGEQAHIISLREQALINTDYNKASNSLQQVHLIKSP